MDLDADPTLYKSAAELVEEYAAFNPHLSVTYREPEYEMAITRTTPDWQKWMPHQPTSAHWYTVERLRALIAAYLTEEKHGGRARTAREFVAEFDSLSGSTKPRRVLEAAGLSRAYLHDLIEHGDVALEPVTRLLAAMRREARPVKPAALGVLGEAHVRTYLTTQCGVEPESLKYYKVQGVADALPFVLELACGWYTDDCSDWEQRAIVGVNWTPALKLPFTKLQALLGEARVDSFDPVMVLVHLAMPRVEFTDRGKSAVALPAAVHEALARGIAAVTKHWKAMKKQKDRDERVRARDREHDLKQRQRQYLNVKQAAYEVMAEAYAQASGRLGLGNARQIMYVARPLVLELTGGKIWKKSSYFTQKLLPNFIDAHPDLTATWIVVFDDRGHLLEPHTEHRIGLSPVAVRNYIEQWHADIATDAASMELDHDYPTMGPANRYRYALFIEKEGFYPLLEAAEIAERYDLAIMSTKGMSVTAARQLVEQLSVQGVTILVCHDFDKSGFSILHTLQSETRRYRFQTRPKVIDLGLRLSDVEAMNLQSEPVEYPSHVDPRDNLRQRGATEEECQYLVRQRGLGGWTGQRVELNAMTSDQFIAWREAKLMAVGVQKVVPDRETLEKAYRRAVRQTHVQRAIDEALEDLGDAAEIIMPDDLVERLSSKLEGSAKSWDAVLWDLVADDETEDEDGEDSEDGESLE
jgi:Protein of unknown function C-terminus (DUF2399)